MDDSQIEEDQPVIRDVSGGGGPTNRFGQIVHSQNSYSFQNNLWDGTTNTFTDKKLKDGVYYYTLELFNVASRRKESYTGYVHLFGNGE